MEKAAEWAASQAVSAGGTLQGYTSSAGAGAQYAGYWTPQDAPVSENTLIYILAHASREAAKTSWDAFRNDSEWQQVQKASEADGKIVDKVESVFMDATDYSSLK